MNMLIALALGQNNLSGYVPSEIGRLKSLVELSFIENKLHDSLHLEMHNLTYLKILELSSNEFRVICHKSYAAEDCLKNLLLTPITSQVPSRKA